MSLIFIFLLLKHIYCDLVLQVLSSRDGDGKGTLSRREGWLHAFEHGIMTFSIGLFVTFDLKIAFTVGLFDFACHYLVDYLKTNCRLRMQSVNAPKWKFVLLNWFDQTAHIVSYCIITIIIMFGLIK